jgi:hypothetical protein
MEDQRKTRERQGFVLNQRDSLRHYCLSILTHQIRDVRTFQSSDVATQSQPMSSSNNRPLQYSEALPVKCTQGCLHQSVQWDRGADKRCTLWEIIFDSLDKRSSEGHRRAVGREGGMPPRQNCDLLVPRKVVIALRGECAGPLYPLAASCGAFFKQSSHTDTISRQQELVDIRWKHCHFHCDARRPKQPQRGSHYGDL